MCSMNKYLIILGTDNSQCTDGIDYRILGPVEADTAEHAVEEVVEKSSWYNSLDTFRLTVYKLANGYKPDIDTMDPAQAGVLPSNQ